MSNAKYKDWILETIDSLRSRKARPDIERICHMVERKHGVAAAETEAELERLVDSEIVIKVDYKGSTSYRNAAKWRKSHLSGNVLNSAETTRSLKIAVRKLTEEDGRNSGTGIREIEKFLLADDHTTKLIKTNLQVALQREVDAGRLIKLKNGTNYTLKDSDSPKKAGRPAKRKRIKKTHGPDFEQEPLSKVACKEEVTDTKCDYCLLTAECNRNGKTEDLLVCKDCNAKAHPSCMNYTQELAVRARMSPWQCFDCKTCCVCGDSGDADNLLFCDACDKGYHMACHTPQILRKPTGKWMCIKCCKDMNIDPASLDSGPATPAAASGESNDEEEKPIMKTVVSMDTSILPTPLESPESPESMDAGEDEEDGAVIENSENKTTREKKVTSPKSDSSPDVATPTAQTANLPEQSAKSGISSDPANWNIKDVANYFKNEGFHEQAHVFEEQEIDGKSLLLLKRSDVLTGLSLKLGPALKMYNHVKKLQTFNQPTSIFT
ncbi:histone acetyltransferase KAT6B-like [Saccoglossus kowalevskii]|uniref:Histone acetyltransferase KAT6A-like n=1 Tax=Saccoglossus kowalevskii TaxID=10224 RepID=A0ABM0GII9_SACKO|nr:PREDICTED: histone acetyltransferase KAT6A-like [Saccoglossus kowalevskii]